MISCLENITFGWYSWLICPSFAVLILIIWSRYCLVYPPCIFSFPLAILIITVEIFLFYYSNFPSTFISQKSSPSFIHSSTCPTYSLSKWIQKFLVFKFKTVIFQYCIYMSTHIVPDLASGSSCTPAPLSF